MLRTVLSVMILSVVLASCGRVPNTADSPAKAVAAGSPAPQAADPYDPGA